MATKRVKIPFEIEIPTHWEVVTNRGIFKEYNARGFDQLQLLSVSQKDGVVLQTEITTKKDTSNDNKTNYKHVMSGDIVYNKMRMWQGAVGVSKYEGIVSPAYVILRAIRGDIDPDYFHYQYRTKFYIKQSGIYSYGLCDDMNSLRYEDFKNMKSILPPIDNQKDIVKKIKHYNDVINEFIRKKEKHIELLKEYKQSKINELVTKGLDPNVKMKDSGIKWLGEIPINWRVSKLKKLVLLNSSKNESKDNKIALENLISWTGRIKRSEGIPFEGDGVSFLSGDVLFCKLRPYLAKVYLANESGRCVNELLVLTPRERLTSEFLFARLLTYNFIQLVNSSTYGAKMPRASWDFIGEIEIAFPVDKEVQSAIYTETQRINNQTEQMIFKAEDQIKTIRKYRQSLIYELVTGIRKP